MFAHQKILGGLADLLGARTPRRGHQSKKSIMKYQNEPYFGLSTRTANICERGNLITRSQILEAINDGRLHPKNKCYRLYGWKAHVEIHKWLGLPEPQQDRPRLKVCPHCRGNLC
jgi:hypothetical protein